MTDESKLKIYSLGIVVETKPDNTDIILVCPIEHINMQSSGLIKDNTAELKGNLKNTDNKGFDTNVKSSSYFKAKWLPMCQSNRITSPNVVANETVLLFKFADVDEYYWTTLFREPELRRLEKVLYAYSNMKKGMEAFDDKSSYWYKVDTKNKVIHLHTSDNDGEHTTYDISINAKEGLFNLIDGKGNSINLNSKSDTINIITNKQITATAPNITLNGNVTINGNTTLNGSLTGNSNASFRGNLKSGPIDAPSLSGTCSGC